MDTPAPSFLVRHEFLIRRLHSLTGLIPVGAYMVVHLLTNASVLESAAAFQLNVYTIHSLGRLLPLVEWVFIFLPILFHAVVGVVITMGGLPNTRSYPYQANVRYTLQRATGMIAFAFIVWHVFHMHGWIHQDWWIDSVRRSFYGGYFRPYNAASSAGVALQSGLVILLYTIGVLSCVFHLANGIWTMGITWGVWISPAAQRRVGYACTVFGLLLSVVGMSALFGLRAVGHGEAFQETVEVENRIYKAKIESGELQDAPHKRSPSTSAEEIAKQAGEGPAVQKATEKIE